MKTAFPDVLGNTALCRRLSREIETEKLSHAYIIAGPAGYGKHMLALRIAAALSCENRKNDGVPIPCMTCPSCRKILESKSPDVIRVTRGDRVTLGVDSIRFLRDDVLIAPNDTEVKTYLIEDAETMTLQAQNAFLLTLEEPPAYVLFLLLTTDPNALLETVRSRAPVLRLEPLPPETIREHLTATGKTAGISADELGDIVSDAGGSLGRALELLHPEERKPLVRQRERIRRFLSLTGAADTVGLLMDLGNKRDEIIGFLSGLLVALRDLLTVRKGEENTPLCFYFSKEEVEHAAAGHSAAELASLYDAVTTAQERIQRNANIRLTLTRLSMDAGLL